MYEIVMVTNDQDISDFTVINIEYIDWIFRNIKSEYGLEAIPMDENYRNNLEAYCMDLIKKFTEFEPPAGAFYLIKSGTEIVGMGGIKKINSNVGEIKRIYVKPNHRGHKLGSKLIEHLINDARIFGFNAIRLETGDYMKSAQKIYRSFGFREIDPYPESEAPEEFYQHEIFMELKLDNSNF